MTLEQNIRAIIDTHFPGFKDEIKESAVERIIDQVNAPALGEAVEDIYPLTVIMDRYCGTYSGGLYTAWNMDYSEISEAVTGDDVSCSLFFELCRDRGIIYGKGRTMELAVIDLIQKLRCGDDNWDVCEDIKSLPKVTHVEKVGHWTRALIRNELGGCIGAKMICSECGQDNGYDKRMKFCPNCGVKMEVEEE